MQVAGLILVGIAAGVCAGMFGIGGGLIIVPALVFFFGMSQHSAVGTSLGAILLPVGALGAYVYWKNGHVNVAYAAWIAAGLVLGAFLGAKLVQPVSDLTLRRMFGVFMIIAAAKMLWGK